jgi:AcrR family transcriptional regulator
MAAPGSSETVAGPDTRGTRGTRSRAGNAMGRTHEAALRGALAAISKYGSRKATMGDIALLAGIAKATLYNHFRTREDVYAAAAAAEVDAIAAAADAKLVDGFAAAVAEAARLLADHAALRRIATDDPVTLVQLATPGDGPVWTVARAHVAAALSEAGYVPMPSAVDLVLRYFTSQALAPSTPEERVDAAALIARAVSGQLQLPDSDPAGTADTSS